MSAAVSRIGIDGNMPFVSEDPHRDGGGQSPASCSDQSSIALDVDVGLAERAFSAAGAAVISAVIMNPLDVAKTRLQAQAAGVPYDALCGLDCSESNKMISNTRSSQSNYRAVLGAGAESTCPRDCSRYKSTLDVFYKVIRQEGISKLWRGTNAGLALAVPTVGIYLPLYDILRNVMEEYTSKNAPSVMPYTPLVAGSIARSLACITCYPVELARTRMQAFRDAQHGVKPPGICKTLLEIVSPVNNINNTKSFQSYRILWTGVGAQLARDVPFSAICWSTLEPLRRRFLKVAGDENNAASVLGANFSAGLVAGSLAAAATCPLDVAKTRRQIENDPHRARNVTTIRTLLEILRDGGVKGLFTGAGPRIIRAGPSTGIVVSFYEIVKYALHRSKDSPAK